jgi:hypothetical protein
MPNLLDVARRLWRSRPVVLTAGRLEDLGDEKFTDGALWGIAFEKGRVEQPEPGTTTPRHPRVRLTSTGTGLFVVQQ